MRRGTLIVIIALLVVILGVAVYQLVVASERRVPGPGVSPTASPNPAP